MRQLATFCHFMPSGDGEGHLSALMWDAEPTGQKRNSKLQKTQHQNGAHTTTSLKD